jgi:transcriptional regulator with XRE-family HTH domain
MKDLRYPDAWPFDFGAYIRKVREDMNLSMAEVVARSDEKMTISGLSVVERNLLPGTPNIRYLEGLSQVYGLPVVYLFALAYISEKQLDPATIDKVWDVFNLERFDVADDEPEGASVSIHRQQLEQLGTDHKHLRFYSLRKVGLLSFEATRQGSVAETDIVGVDSERTPESGELVAGWWRQEAKLLVYRHEHDKRKVIVPAQRQGEPYRKLEDVGILEFLGVVVWRSGATPERGS